MSEEEEDDGRRRGRYTPSAGRNDDLPQQPADQVRDHQTQSGHECYLLTNDRFRDHLRTWPAASSPQSGSRGRKFLRRRLLVRRGWVGTSHRLILTPPPTADLPYV